MTVFRVYWKIVYKNLASISITFIVFLILCFLFVETDPKQSYEFEPTKTTVTIINKDADNELLNGLTEYLTNYANFKDIEEKNIEDALYYRDIYLAIIIPEGFTDSFLAGEEARIIEKSVPDVANTVAIKLAINNYFNTVRLYLNHTDESIDEIIPDVITDLEKSINVEKTSKEEQRPVEAAYYYNYLSYILISVFITIVGTVMLSFRQKRIRQRITVSPVQQTKLNFQLILGHLVMALIITAVMCGLSFAFYPKGMAGDRGILLIINAFCVSLATVSMAYALTFFIRTKTVLGALTNIGALGTCFISGAFVPQSLLSKGMLTIARVFPNYYYVRNNDLIGFLNNLSSDALNKIILNMVIQLLFAVGFMIISLIISRKQMTSEN